MDSIIIDWIAWFIVVSVIIVFMIICLSVDTDS